MTTYEPPTLYPGDDDSGQTRCPRCGFNLMPHNGDRVQCPTAGTPTVCPYCGLVLVAVGRRWEHRRPDKATEKVLLEDPRVKEKVDHALNKVDDDVVSVTPEGGETRELPDHVSE